MIDLVIPARRKDLGDGFEVGRVLPYAQRRMVGPFIFLDHMGPVTFKPGQGIDVRPHPHIGLSTVTYLYAGEMMHRDSLGSTLAIRPGEVNWMTAGRGIVHSERTAPDVRAKGGLVHGLQTWVALPDAHAETAPAFTHYGVDDMPKFENGGARGVVIAGSAFGLTSAVTTHSPLFYVDVELDAGAEIALPDNYSERAAYIVHGRVESGGIHDAHNLLVFGPGPAKIAAGDEPARVMLLGGEPVGPRHIWWNFVAVSEQRLEQAKADWKAGRMSLPPDDNGEFIPLPE
ncbi:MAG: pirin family protein [Rhodospirillaceae bacterium]|nr:pirin family protein [Rhodospirillaceae bacterium]